MTLPAPTVRVLVCGTADRGDDGAALAAVAHLLPRLEPDLRTRVEIRRCPQLDATDLIDVADHEACLILDTAMGIEAGAIVTLPLTELACAGAQPMPRSSHALPIQQVLGIAEAVRGSLPTGSFVGIGGRWFGYGTRFSRAVRLGIPCLEDAVLAEIQRLAGPIAAPGSDAEATGSARLVGAGRP